MTVNKIGVAPSLDSLHIGVDGRTRTYTVLFTQVIYVQVCLFDVLALSSIGHFQER